MNFDRMIRASRSGALTAVLLSVSLTACGELTSGGVGEVEVWTTADDPQSSGSTSAHAFAPTPEPHGSPAAAPASPSGAASSAAAAEGVLTAQLRAYLRSDVTGEWIEITDGVRDLTLDLNGQSERRAGVRFLASGRYTGFRVVFQRVEANVSAGLVVSGVPILGLVRVDLGTQGSLTVERGLVLEVEGGGEHDIVLDLAADLWLPSLSLTTRTVAASALQSAVGLRIR